MAGGLHKLSAIGVEKLKEPGKHPDGGGLYVKVTAGLTKSWIFRYSQAGKRPEIGLGSYPQVTLAKARELAASCREALANGNDPREALQGPPQAGPEPAGAVDAGTPGTTFDEAAKRFIAAHEGSWKNAKHRQQWRNTLATYVSPVSGAVEVAEVDTDHVLRVLEPIWNEKPETASRVRGRIESVLDWCKARGLRQGENPARWRGHLKHLLPARSKVAAVNHHAAMPWREVPEFMAELRLRDAPAALALRLLILTATRTSEVLKAGWSEFDLERGEWVIPEDHMQDGEFVHRTKKGREHRIPLSPAALEVIAELGEVRQNHLLIPGMKRGRPLSDMSMLMLLRRMGRGDLTVHGFRSSFRDWAAEATSYPWEIAEAALAHQVGDATERAYARTDFFAKRRALMNDWATFCTGAEASAVAAE